VGVTDAIGVAAGEGSGVGSTGFISGLADGFGAGLIATPLFQINFEPDLMQVNFLPPDTEVDPTFAHLLPALTAAKEGVTITVSANKSASKKRDRLIKQRYQPAIRN
jgi:hypothetical protein